MHQPENELYGDCHRATVASIFECQLTEVPNFGHEMPDGEEFNRRVDVWLKGRGFYQISVAYDCDFDVLMTLLAKLSSDVYYLLGGTSRTGVNHSVVGCGGAIVHDPSLVDSGIIGPCDDGFYWATWFVPARFARSP